MRSVAARGRRLCRSARDYHAAVIVLGVDPGTASLGFGVVSLHAGSLRLVDAGRIRTDASRGGPQRLADLHSALAGLIAEHRPQLVGVERLFFQRNVQTAMAVGEARGVALLAAAQHGLPVEEPTPNEVKQAVCGNGAAGKEQVADMVGRLLHATLDGLGDDATDALAVAIGCLYRATARAATARALEPAR